MSRRVLWLLPALALFACQPPAEGDRDCAESALLDRVPISSLRAAERDRLACDHGVPLSYRVPVGS